MATITKKQLALKYEISSETLRKLLNERYYQQLIAVGYKKKCSILPPKVVRVFVDIYGKSLNDDEI